MSPNNHRGLCKEELSLLQRESLRLFFHKEPPNNHHDVHSFETHAASTASTASTAPADNGNNDNQNDCCDTKGRLSKVYGHSLYKFDVHNKKVPKTTPNTTATTTTDTNSRSRRDFTRDLWHKMTTAMMTISSPSPSTASSSIIKSINIPNNTNSSSNNIPSHIRSSICQQLSTIRILNNNSNNKQWLQSYNGTVSSLPLDFILTLKKFATPKFHARVADFNNNLFFDMQNQYGLNHLLLDYEHYDPSHSSYSSYSSSQLQLQQQINLDKVIYDVTKCNQFLGSYMATERTIPQPPHVDFTWERLKEYGHDLRIGFFPLTSDGMFLQLWKRGDDGDDDRKENKKCIYGEVVFIPFGKILILPASTIHGGGFRSTPRTSTQSTPTTAGSDDTETTNTQKKNHHGNLRFHLYLANNRTRLSKNQTTNKYTEPNDKTRELADRYVDAPVMEELCKSLFV